MKTKKISLVKIQGKLSRDEMKNIMAGDAELGSANYCGTTCNSNADCTVSAICLTCGTDRKCL